MDSHPSHIHLVQFQVVNRQMIGGPVRPPEPSETGFKDTVIVFPNEITRVQARFDRAGRFVWHCHILEHEDNEMMRPYNILPAPNGNPPNGGNRPPVICVRRRCGLLQRWRDRRRGRRRCR